MGKGTHRLRGHDTATTVLPKTVRGEKRQAQSAAARLSSGGTSSECLGRNTEYSQLGNISTRGGGDKAKLTAQDIGGVDRSQTVPMHGNVSSATDRDKEGGETAKSAPDPRSASDHLYAHLDTFGRQGLDMQALSGLSVNEVKHI